VQTGAVLLSIPDVNGIDLQQKIPNRRNRFLSSAVLMRFLANVNHINHLNEYRSSATILSTVIKVNNNQTKSYKELRCV